MGRHSRRSAVATKVVWTVSMAVATGVVVAGAHQYFQPVEAAPGSERLSLHQIYEAHPDRILAANPVTTTPFGQVVANAAAAVTTPPPPPTTTAPPSVVRVTNPKPKPSSAPAPQVKLTAGCSSTGFGLKANAAQVAHHIEKMFNPPTILGFRATAIDPAGHPSGQAIDFMVGRVLGDKIADYLLSHKKDLGVEYVIWEQRINTGSGWKPMEDRGGDTANHFDHVHVNIVPGVAVPGATC